MMRHRALVASVVGGLLGGLVGAAAMSAAHTAISRARPPAPPPTDRHEDDATVKVADALSRALRHAPLPEHAKPLAGSIVHYAFGATTGLVQGIAAGVTRLAGVGGGLGFGAAVWLGAHVVTVPALGLAPSPRRQPLDQEGIEFALHLLFGVCAEQVRRVAVRLAG
jgi:putative membrane protein